MKIKRFSILFLVAALLCFNHAIPSTAVSTFTTADVETLSPHSDIIGWRFKIENGKLYKRLYNSSTDEWIGDWIYVCDYK